MAACLLGNSRWPLFLVKLYTSLPIKRCIDLSNPSRIDRDAIFFKDICNSRGNAPPTNSNVGIVLPPPLRNRSGRHHGTTPTTWLNFYTLCKSQLKNVWPVSPAINLHVTCYANDSNSCIAMFIVWTQTPDTMWSSSLAWRLGGFRLLMTKRHVMQWICIIFLFGCPFP